MPPSPGLERRAVLFRDKEGTKSGDRKLGQPSDTAAAAPRPAGRQVSLSASAAPRA